MERVKFGIQKSGRLTEKSLDLLRNCGYEIDDPHRKIIVSSENSNLDAFFLRDDDIPHYILQGLCDFGIVGLNLIEEKFNKEINSNKLKVVQKLPFGKCRLSLAFKPNEEVDSLSDINGKTIATSYPNILKRILDRKKISVQVKELRGGVEIAPIIKMADGIFDIVSSGGTLRAHGLKEYFTLMESQCVIVSSSNLSEAASFFIAGLLKRIKSHLIARKKSYIMLNVSKPNLDKVIDILPGADSPSIIELSSNREMVSVHALTKKEVVWETMEKLKEFGASNILVMPVDKMME